MKYINKILTLIASLLTLIAIFCLGNNVYASNLVKVGFFYSEGYHEITEDGVKTGYGYEFLRMVSGYTGLEYEYVGYEKGWNDMFQLLSNGEIDLLTKVQYTEERAAQFDYSNSPMGYSEAVLSTNAKQTKIKAGDYSTYNNIKIGMVLGSAYNNNLVSFANKHNFNFQLVYYNNMADLEKAMDNGVEIDAMLTTSVRKIGNEIVLDRFDRTPYYAIVRKGNSELMDKVNYAINKLDTNYKAWKSVLENKYFSNNNAYLSLSLEEIEFLNDFKSSNEKISVLINPDLRPYSYIDGGEYKGILVDYFNKICKLYDIEASYMDVKNSNDYINLAKENKAQIILAPSFLQYEADIDGYNLTQTFLPGSFCLINRTGAISDGIFEGKRIAIVTGMTSIEQAAKNAFENSEFVFYNTVDECIKAVKDRTVDGTIVYGYTAYQYLNNDWEDELEMYEIPNNEINFVIAVSKNCNPIMYNLMNNAINTITDSQIQEIIFNTLLTENEANESFFAYFKHHPVLTNTLISILIILVVLVAVIYVLRLKKKRAIAEYEANHDPLTGAYNRLKLETILNKHSDISKNIGMLTIDVDYFKNVNDSFGHEMGDNVLKSVVSLLSHEFEDNGIVFRIGGDEFLILLKNTTEKDWNDICKTIERIHEKIKSDIPDTMTVSFSVGACFSTDGIYGKMLGICDAALYHTKKMGRAGCTLMDAKKDVMEYWKNSQTKFNYKQIIEGYSLNPWELVIEEDGTRKLFAGDVLTEYLQLPLEATPEEVYNIWYEQILKDNLDDYQKMYAEMKNGNTTELTLCFKHPTKGSITARIAGKDVSRNNKQEVYSGFYQFLNGMIIL